MTGVKIQGTGRPSADWAVGFTKGGRLRFRFMGRPALYRGRSAFPL